MKRLVMIACVVAVLVMVHIQPISSEPALGPHKGIDPAIDFPQTDEELLGKPCKKGQKKMDKCGNYCNCLTDVYSCTTKPCKKL
uniref:Uncharacterized protein n=2 Tax=Timema TaxID=61471 RepID=A0A7R9G4Y2_TIMSH|nr:unnamed protein product [Timema shepardi]